MFGGFDPASVARSVRGLAATAALAAATLCVPAGNAEELFVLYGHTGEVVPVPAGRYSAIEYHDSVRTSGGVTFNFSYADVSENTNIGFDDPTNGQAARDAMAAVAQYVGSVLNHTGSADIRVERSLNNPSSTLLGQAGSFFQVSSGFRMGLMQQHILTGADPFAGNPDGTATFNFGRNWNFDFTAPTPGGVFDFFSVALHELTHALGFASLTTSNGSSPLGNNVRTIYDRDMETGNGLDLMPNNGNGSFAGTAAHLTGSDGGVVLKQTEAIALFGRSPEIFAPNPFRNGSSLSHFDFAVPGALMHPSFTAGENKRSYTLVEIATLDGLGYNIRSGAFPSPTPTPSPSPSPSPSPTPQPFPFLKNISTRGTVGSGDALMIAGIIVGGALPLEVLVSGVGPDLQNFGVTDTLENPVLALLQGPDLLESNDDWMNSPNADRIRDSGFAPNDPREAAIHRILDPGSYTAVLSGTGATDTGVGIVQVFNVGDPHSKLDNISTRLFAGSGSNVMIAGFILDGAGVKRVLVRALGPTLGTFGVSDFLADPSLVLFANGFPVGQNNDWMSAANSAAIMATGFSPPDARESAILVDLMPGNYTAILQGADGGVGNALVEIYRIED